LPDAVPNAALALAKASPGFTEHWPQWARFLMGAPLQIVIVLLSALVVLAVVHAVIRRATDRMAGGGRRGRKRGASVVAAAGLKLGGAPQDEAAIERAAARRAARYKTLGSVLNSVVSVVVWVLAIGMVLENLGVNVGLIVTSLGVAGVAVGLGAQSLVKDMVAGIFILVEDQYGLGDLVDAGPATGVIESMSLRITTLRDADGVVWYIPNGSIARVGNKTQEARVGPKTQDGAQAANADSAD
jgi:small conductance mechanosensitive channel